MTGGRTATEETARVLGLHASRLSLHADMLRDISTSRGLQMTSLHDVVRLVLGDQSLLDLLSEVRELVRLMLTVPATSCASERSFSLLRRLKSYLRSTLSQPRLNYAAVCATYGEEMSGVDMDSIMGEFIRRTPQRVRLFGVV